MTLLEAITLFLVVVTGILVPVILYVVKRQDSDRAARFGELNGRLSHLDGRIDHLDNCIDKLQIKVIGQAIMRTDFEAAILNIRRELQEAIAAQNEARQSQTTLSTAQILLIEERIARRLQRLEDVYFSRGGAAQSGERP